jgi:hypothetical protein
MHRLLARGERLLGFTLLLGLFAAACPAARSQAYSILHSFTWTDGRIPRRDLSSMA